MEYWETDELAAWMKVFLSLPPRAPHAPPRRATAVPEAMPTPPATDAAAAAAPAAAGAHPDPIAVALEAGIKLDEDGQLPEGLQVSASGELLNAEGQPLSKSALKKLQKGKKERKKAAPAPAPGPKREKKLKKEKPPELIFTDSTPEGQRKDITGEFPPTYQPRYVEAAWGAWWEAQGFFRPDVQRGVDTPTEEKFVMVIPPPNVTGSLHVGHALMAAVEDTITRWHRMCGRVSLWVPGTDHAGIATQSVVEKKLKKEEQLTRHDLGRDAFVQRVKDWKDRYGNRICQQIRLMGASVDWSREAFTMDDKLSRAVLEAFCRFHDDGLLYRANRLVNWSCALRSAISEIEVDYEDIPGFAQLSVPNHGQGTYEFGTLTSFAYKIVPLDGEPATDEEIVVATTRLETMLGDTAVAVHPDDPRYTHLHGRFVRHPFAPDRPVPIVLDAELVDMAFGTGAVKITPAHDPNDYQCGLRHELPMITVLSLDGRINEHGGERFKGMMRYDARIAVAEALEEMGLLRGKEPNPMRLGRCSRTGDIIEPILCPQWYVNCKPMAEKAVQAVRSGELKILPEFHKATWYRWLENCRDWCISRQLWWGHRIPAYFARTSAEAAAGGVESSDMANNHRWIVARTLGEATAKAAALLGVGEGDVVLEQDEDVLDTWFSSGLFPFSVFGWPDETEDLRAFYPTSLLETGMDILFFWVARMVMMGQHLTGQLPFRTVYLHAMVRDKYGRKMSKSLGNTVDPLEVVYGCPLGDLKAKLDQTTLPEAEIVKAKEGLDLDFPDGIPECGADALRFGLLAYTVQGRDVNLDIKRVVGWRQFCNKLWNAVRFALLQMGDVVPPPGTIEALHEQPLATRDRFILHRLNECARECGSSMEGYQFAALTTALHAFWLYDLCDVYLELIKPVVGDTSEENAPARRAAQMTLFTCLDCGLRLLHPIMPFVTEELWQRLPGRQGMIEAGGPPSITIASYPSPKDEWHAPETQETMEELKRCINQARRLRDDYNVPPSARPSYVLQCKAPPLAAALRAQLDDFATLAKAGGAVVIGAEDVAPQGCAVKVISDQLTVMLELRGLVDADAEIQRLNKQLAKVQQSLDNMTRKAESPDYETKVPEAVREKNTQKMQELRDEISSLNTAMDGFRALGS